MKVQHYKAEGKQTTAAPFKCPHASMCVCPEHNSQAIWLILYFIIILILLCRASGYIFLNILSLNKYFLIDKAN